MALLLELEDIKWRQRAKRSWYQLVDKNTKFFDSCASQRRRKNQVKELKNPLGSLVAEQEEIEGVFCHYFNSIFSSSYTTMEEIEECLKEVEPIVTSQMNEELQKEFT